MEMLMNELDEVVFVCDLDSHELLYVNNKGRKVFGLEDGLRGRCCYQVIWGLEKPCEDCDNCRLKHDQVVKEEGYNPYYQRIFLKTKKLIYWHGYEARMEVDIDITESQIAKEELKDRLETEYVMVDSINQINSAENLNEAVHRTLSRIGRFFEADRVLLYETGRIRKGKLPVYYWCADGSQLPGDYNIEAEEALASWKQLYTERKSGVLLEGAELSGHHPEIWRRLNNGRVERVWAVACMVLDGKAGYIQMDNPKAHLAGCPLTSAYLNFVVDEIQGRRMREELEHLSFYDELTDVGNRRRYRRFRYELDNTDYHSLGIVSMNINKMNEINNMYGQKYGDDILKNLADCLLKFFPQESVFRTSGDEFVVYCPDMSREKFISTVKGLQDSIQNNAYYTVAVGFAWDDSGIGHKVLHESAKEYMHLDKREYYIGKKGDLKDYQRQTVEAVLRCIEEGHFKVYYQPKVDILTEKIIGAEALVRYEDDEVGLVSPARFIPRLEVERTICYLDCHIFKQVGELLDRRYREKRPIMTISLNFSRRTLTWPRLMSVLEEYCKEWIFPKEYLEIELTESVGDVGKQTMILLVNQLKAMGFRVSLDDFGVQYTNLSVLTTIDFDVLKLDKTLIDEISVNPKSKIVVQSVVNVCRQIHTKCLAEGVEAWGQVEELKAMGCDYIQGYLFGKPMPQSEFFKE